MDTSEVKEMFYSGVENSLRKRESSLELMA